jgi:hypothetical protein
MTHFRLFFSLLSLFFLTTCATAPVIQGEKHVIEKSHPSKPDWVIDIPKETEKVIYSVGVRTDSPSLDGGETDARMNAARKILERFFGLKATIEYQKLRKTFETNYLDQMKATGGGEIFGTKTKSVYWEKYEIKQPDKITYSYDVWVLLEVKVDDITKALDKMEKRRREYVNLSRELLNKLSGNICNPESLREISEYENSLAEFEGDPEVNALLMQMGEKQREVESCVKSIAVYISEKNLGEEESGFIKNMLIDVLKKYSFHIKEMTNIPESQEQLGDLAKKEKVSYLLTVDVNTVPGNEKSGYFLFAYAKGKMIFKEISTGKVLLTAGVNEKAAGTDLSKAGSGALKITAKVLSQKLEDTIKGMW